jgi:hypothetical protein
MNINDFINFGAVVNDTNADNFNFIIVIMIVIILILVAIFMFSPKD